MTMQTFVVLLLGILFGMEIRFIYRILYLIEGIAGLPVFAGTPEKGMGIVYFTGPTMGYLIGFLVAVFLTGFFTFDNNFFKNFIKLTILGKFYIYFRINLARII